MDNIGEVLETIQAAMEIPETASEVFCERSQIDHLMALPTLTLAQCETLRDLAIHLPDSFVPATPQQIARQLEFIAATLPSKNIDEESGQMRFAVYVRLLAGHAKAALSYMTERACRELDWFPTPRQCLAILEDYSRPSTEREKVMSKVNWEMQRNLDAFMDALWSGPVEQATIDAQPLRWRRIAMERGYLRQDGETYVQRQRTASA